MQNGLIKYKGSIWIGNIPTLHASIVRAFHGSHVDGHSSSPTTYKRIHSLFYLIVMRKFIKEIVQACLICQQAKPERVAYHGLLCPLLIPRQAWEMVTMDFYSGLPTSGGYNCILVVIDNFTKYGRFIALHHLFSAQVVAETFIDDVYKLHIMPNIVPSGKL